MRPLSVPHVDALDLFRSQLRDFVAAVDELGDQELLGGSRCYGWSRLDLVVHVRMGLEEVVGGCTAQTGRAPDHDAASYWSASVERDDDPVPHILWLRRTASAYGRPSAAVRHLHDVAARLAPALDRLPEEPVAFQGTVMTSGDFLASWVVELTVHQLDLDLDPGSPSPGPEALALTRRTVEAIADQDLPAALDDRTGVLVGLGRTTPPPGVELPRPAYPVTAR
ncbi:maleylpyruvate isomerase N-terminal domain-containing protein [Ornithinicoccus halotolerans]|uniref:maleylpyruvate isomerase N-terminal domain-containing protein n=1 Tax=Ornithinicoccus halotolerans TaxID=1748220 RepID=UPI0012978B33|nr:maleylpyruvate isomerase N-terminal domain-containing protein [Ornithinicoccus halotolerans]